MKLHYYGLMKSFRNGFAFGYYDTPYGLQIDCGFFTLTISNGVQADVYH